MAVVKNIASVVLGYLGIFVVTFVCFAVLWTALGADGSFQPGSWTVSGAWTAGAIVVALAAGVVGGFVSGKVATGSVAPKVLAVIVVGLGMLQALTNYLDEAGPRPESVSMFDAAEFAVYPAWAAWLIALLGAAGVLFGASKARGRAEPEA